VSRVKTSLSHKRIRFLVWLVLTVFVLLGYSLHCVTGSAYYSMFMQNYAAISTPPVILQNGTAGTCTIYTNNTRAKVSVVAPLGNLNETADAEPSFTYGSVVGGSYTDTQSDNGQTENIYEQTGLPGGNVGIEGYYTVDTDVSEGDITALKICTNAWHTAENGAGDDGLIIRVWDYGTSSWDTTTIIVEATSDGTTYVDLTTMGNEHVRDSDGQIRIGFIDERRGGGKDLQDTYYIDYLYVQITSAAATCDYVLRVNNTATDSWEIRLTKYSDSSINRLENCTIYFHNSTDGTSNQIIIENGSYINQNGPWYDLGNLETICIAMTVQANSAATSYIYTYLEIRTPNTATYAQYVITFEIT
jgi:hypothetical protein